ncbi:MAG: sulfotransferase [Thiohalocapsa sp.]
MSKDEILDSACRRTGLSDWGDERFLTPLDILVKALESEAQLNPCGRALMRALLTVCVENRLRLRRYVAKHPDALGNPLAPCLIVVGMPRTGTTLLYNLLAQDQAARPLLGWESLSPAPNAGNARVDWRPLKAHAVDMMMSYAADDLRHIHPFSVKAPEECTWLMANTLASWAFSLFAYVPSYEEWLWGLGDTAWVDVYREYRMQLLVLQHQRPGVHWVLKSPVHLMSLGPLLETIESARVVLTERDPVETVPSTCSLFAVMRAISSDQVDRHLLGSDVVKRLSEGMRRADAALTAQPRRLTKIQFRDLVTDPNGAVRSVYDHFGMDLPADAQAAMQQWMSATPHSPTHNYELAQFGLTELEIANKFG